MRFLALAILMAVQVAFGQAAFEVASVRQSPAGSGASPRGIEINGDNVHIGPMLLLNLIATAYGVPNQYVEGPDWLTSLQKMELRLFDVNAKLPAGAGAGRAEAPQMLKKLLAERFALSAEQGSKQVEAIALSVGKNGAKLPPKSPGQESRTKDEKGRTLISIGTAKLAVSAEGAHVESAKIQGLGDYFSIHFGPPVLDETGLTGEYDIKLDIAPADIKSLQQDGARPTAEALREQSIRDVSDAVERLGLKLERKKAIVKTVLVKSVEKNPTEN